MRLAADSREYSDRAHFLSTAATAMRQVVVDYARYGSRKKRGGDLIRVTLNAEELSAGRGEVDVLVIHDALKRLEEWDARQAKIVELRFFAGLSSEETAEALQLSERTVRREWVMARAWLEQELASPGSGKD